MKVLSTIKIGKSTKRAWLVEKYRKKDEKIEKKIYSSTSEGIDRIGHDSIRILGWMVHCVGCYENLINYFSIESVLSALTQNNWNTWMVKSTQKWNIRDLLFAQLKVVFHENESNQNLWELNIK